jgi:hypothetical protein
MPDKSRPVQVTKADEPWCYVHLADGTILKHRPIVMGVIQMLDEKGEPKIDENGCNIYAAKLNVIQMVEHSPMIEERQPAQVTNIRKN